MKLKSLLAGVAAATALAGCDFYYGVTRISPTFQPYPETACVIAATYSIEGVSEVSYSEEQGRRPLTLTGLKVPDKIHRFEYEYKGIVNNFYFTVTYDGTTELRHDYGCLNCIPPQEKIDTIYPFFLALERELEDQCGMSALSTSMQEYCDGVDCPG